jgi:hypothetical protein
MSPRLLLAGRCELTPRTETGLCLLVAGKYAIDQTAATDGDRKSCVADRRGSSTTFPPG